MKCLLMDTTSEQRCPRVERGETLYVLKILDQAGIEPALQAAEAIIYYTWSVQNTCMAMRHEGMRKTKYLYK